jgi:glutaredoxin
MMTLYVKTGCPYCAKVIRVVDGLGLTVTYKNKDDAGVVDELIARGGKSQYPYLVDDTHQVAMYESDAIISYLNEHYGG